MTVLKDDPYHAFLPYPSADVPHAAHGPLSGLSLGVKDIFDVKGYPTGCGQPHALSAQRPHEERDKHGRKCHASHPAGRE